MKQVQFKSEEEKTAMGGGGSEEGRGLTAQLKVRGCFSLGSILLR